MRKHFLIATIIPAISTNAQAAPTGKLGFIGVPGAQVWNLSTGKVTTIPRSAKTDNFTLSPRGDALFTIPNGKKSKQSEDLSDAFLSRPPYTTLKTIPALMGPAPYDFSWSPSGNTVYLNSYDFNRAYSPATGAVKKLPFSMEGFDAKGRLFGYSTEKEVIIHDVQTNKDRILYSTKNPKPLFDALRRAKNPKLVKDLLDGESMLKESYAQWQFSGPVLSPDGTRAYFTSNAGTGYGAAGNGMQGYFACDLKSGTISVLSKMGEDFGRPPKMTMSPDGKRILSVVSVHDSAADNSSYATIIDLETQKTREILFSIPGAKDRANWYGGSAWSPDGKYVALSAYFYDSQKAMDALAKNSDWEQPPASAWKTAIFDAATGKLLKLRAGMRSPSWSR